MVKILDEIVKWWFDCFDIMLCLIFIVGYPGEIEVEF